MDPYAPEQEAPQGDALVAPVVESAPPEPAAPDVVAPTPPVESEPSVSPVSTSNIEITDEPEPAAAPEPEDEPSAPVDLGNPPAVDPAVPLAPSPAVSVVPAAPVVPAAFDPRSADELNFLRTVLSPRAWASHRARTQAKLDRIMALARQKGQIDRTDVRDLLNKSKPACTRYLTALVKQGKLTRHRVLDDMVYRVVG